MMGVWALILFIATTVGAQPAEPPAAPPPSPFQTRLAALDARLATVNDVRAHFEQRKSTSLLKKPMVSSGRLTGKDKTVLWETTEPRRTSMLVTEESVKLWYPADHLLEVYPVGARLKETPMGPIPRLPTLTKLFEVTELDPHYLTDQDTTNFIAINLTPRDADLKSHIAQVRVLIDERIPSAVRVIISDPDGDSTELRFSSVLTNGGLSDKDVALSVPDGTRVTTPLGPVDAPRR